MTLQELTIQGLKKMEKFNIAGVMPSLAGLNDGALEDVLNVNGCANYQWIPGVIDILKPKQIVELGGAMGVWDLMVLYKLPEDSHLYSITLPEGGLEFSYILDKYPNFTPIIGDDLDMNNWKGVDLEKTDLWYFDTLHEESQLIKELDLYHRFFKKDAVVLFDDIHLNDGMERVWNRIQKGEWEITDTYDATDPLHYSGYGCCRI